MAVRILLAEDHSFFRRSIRSICISEGYEEIDEVDSCRELLEKLAAGRYTHLVLDFTLADGSTRDIIDRIFNQFPSLRILIFSSYPTALYAARFRELYGISYIHKGEPEQQSLSRLLCFLKDERSSLSANKEEQGNPFATLTEKEKQNLQYILMGWSTEKIGDKLNITPSVVRTHKTSIMRKTKTENLIELKELARIYKIEF